MCQLTDTVYQTCGCRSPRKETCPAYRQWSSDCGACLGSILVSRTPPCGTMRQPAILTVGRCSDCDKRARRYEERRERMVCLAASHRAHKNCWETGCSPEGNRPGDVSVRDSFIEDGLAAAVITLPGPEWPEFCPKDALWYKGPSSKSSNGSSSSRSSPPRGYPNNSSKSNSSNSGQLRQKPPPIIRVRRRPHGRAAGPAGHLQGNRCRGITDDTESPGALGGSGPYGGIKSRFRHNCGRIHHGGEVGSRPRREPSQAPVILPQSTTKRAVSSITPMGPDWLIPRRPVSQLTEIVGGNGEQRGSV